MAKKVATKAIPEAATTTPVVDEVVDTTTDVKSQSADVIVSERFEQLNQQVVAMTTLLRELQNSIKLAQKELTKVVKTNVKKGKSRASNGAKKTPSGFAKPTKLSDALCVFLGVESGTELARTDVTRRINTYIKEHTLQDEKDKRMIHPDAALGNILSNMDGVPLTFFNMQSKIKHNFIKA